MRSLAPIVALILGVAGCSPTARPSTVHAPPDAGPSRPFRPERMRLAVAGKELPAVRKALAGRWRFRVTVVATRDKMSVGHFAAGGNEAAVERTGLIAVRLPDDAGPGQTWEVEAPFDLDRPILREQGVLVWRFARPTSAMRAG